MSASLRRLSAFFMAAFVIVAAALVYWGIVRRADLISRQDNPRLILAEEQVRRGDIIDHGGVILATSRLDPVRGTYTRVYPHPEATTPVGYYTLDHGTGGIERTFDPVLHGDQFLTPSEQFFAHLMHRQQIGGDVRLTLVEPLQQAIRADLANHRGAVIVLDAASGGILGMDSAPSYNPDTLDADWAKLSQDPGAPLLNRATQALYQPGTILQSIILGEALNRDIATPDVPVSGVPTLTARLDGGSLPCASDQAHDIRTLQDAFLWSCPGPFQVLGEGLGAQTVRDGFAEFGLYEAPLSDLPMAVPGTEARLAPGSPGLAAIGQGSLAVTPLHLALVAAAFANNGQMPVPHIAEAIRAPGGGWLPYRQAQTPRGTISRDNADKIAALMRLSVGAGAAHAAYSPDLPIYGHVGLALAGPGFLYNTWFIGFAYDQANRPIAIAVLLENTRDPSLGAQIGGDILRSAVRGRN